MEKLPRFVSATMVRSTLSMPSLKNAMQTALKEFSSKQVSQPVRSVVNVQHNDGFLGMMGAYSPNAGLGTKIVTFFPQNSPPIPTHHAIIMMFNADTGQVDTIMDGEVVTEMRTAACSAVSARLLASPSSSRLAVIGTGVQAKSHIEALKEEFPWQQITIFGRTPSKAEALAQHTREALPSAEVATAASVEEAVSDADVVIVATASKVPVLNGAWIKPGAHVAAVGACRPDWREMDDDMMRGALVFSDSTDAAKKESGDVILSGSDIEAELGALVDTDTDRYRKATTVFKSLGMAIEDVAAARLVLQSME